MAAKKRANKTRKSHKKSSGNKLYYFKGRNTGVAAPNAKEAKKRKKRPKSDKIVAVRNPSTADRKAMRKGRWTTTRKDGKSKAKSKFGKGRGQGPKRGRKK